MPLPLALDAVTEAPAKVTDGAGMSSEDVKLRVRLSPDFAQPVATLDEAREMSLSAGVLVSSLTVLARMSNCEVSSALFQI